MPRPTRLPCPIPIRTAITENDIRSAVKASLVLLVGAETDITACCGLLNYALRRAVTPGRGPDQAIGILKRLERLMCGDLTALPDRTRLSVLAAAGSGVVIGSAGKPDLLIDRLREAQLVRRLLDPEWTISDDPGQAMPDVAELAAAAAAQIRAGVARTKRDQGAVSRLRAQALGLEAIHTYRLLAGRPVRVSRTPDGCKGVPGTPTGPLIRFLHEFYHCVRTRLAALDGNRDIADMEALNPKPETLVGWVKAFNLDRTESRT